MQAAMKIHGTRLPLTPYLDPVPGCLWENDLGTLTGHAELIDGLLLLYVFLTIYSFLIE